MLYCAVILNRFNAPGSCASRRLNFTMNRVSVLILWSKYLFPIYACFTTPANSAAHAGVNSLAGAKTVS